MAATYEPIATTTVSGSSTTNITFSSIPSTYTDLMLIIFVAGGPSYAKITFNSDTGSNYSRTQIAGDGSSATSSRESNFTSYRSINIFNSTTFNPVTIQIMNYSNTTTYKTLLDRGGVANDTTYAQVGLWRSTAAINSINFLINTGIINAGSTFTLYGIKAA
jgi:hypothetical protein